MLHQTVLYVGYILASCGISWNVLSIGRFEDEYDKLKPVDGVFHMQASSPTLLSPSVCLPHLILGLWFHGHITRNHA
jgi:hypothetical protein